MSIDTIYIYIDSYIIYIELGIVYIEILVFSNITDKQKSLSFSLQNHLLWTEQQRELVDKCQVPKDIAEFKSLVYLFKL